MLAFSELAGFLFLNTLYLQEGRGYRALHAGLLTLPMAAMICAFAPVPGRLAGTRARACHWSWPGWPPRSALPC